MATAKARHILVSNQEVVAAVCQPGQGRASRNHGG